MGTVPSAGECLERLRELHARIRRSVTGPDRPGYGKAPVHADGPHDFAFRPDVIAEEVLAEYCAAWASDTVPMRVLTEETVERRHFPY